MRRRILLKPVFVCLSILLMVVAVHAQRYPFYNLSIEQGLIQSQATSLAQDQAGHLWIGTLGGLSRYDGHSFTNYSVRDGLPSNAINVIAQDKHGMLWIGTDKGLAAYDGKTFRQFTFQSAENLQGNSVTAIQPAKNNTYCIAGRKLYVIKDSKVASVPHPHPERNVTAIYTSAQGLYVALSKSDTFYILREKKWIGIPVLAESKPYSILKFFEDKQHKMWLLTTEGLQVIDNQNYNWHRPANAEPNIFRGMTDMAQGHDGNYWISTRNGIIRMTDTTIRRYQKQNGLTDNTIFALLNDAEGNIWIATDGLGLFRFSGAPFTALDESMNMPSAQIMGLAADDAGGIFLGTYDAGLFYYKNELITAIPFPQKYVPNIVTLARGGNGYLWIGTRNEGLWRYKNGNFRQFTPKDYKLAGVGVTALRADDAGKRIWIGFTDGAVVYEADTFRVLPVNTSVLDFLMLKDDDALLATNNGLKLYRNELIVPYSTGGAADHATPQCLAAQGNYLWFGTSDNGLIAYDTTTRKTIILNKKSGLRSDFIYNLYAAPNGNIWAGTGYGIYRISMEKGLPVITFYGRGQGVTGIENNHNAVLGLPDGSIWFGTTNGAMHYRPGMLNTSARPVSIVLQSVKLFGENISDSSLYSGTSPYYAIPQNLQLPYRSNNLTFTFQAITLSDEAGISYRYRMNGLETKWSEWSATNTVTYSALPPGDYSLAVECRSQGNPGALQTLTYPFHIATPFHKTGLFRLLILGGCILLGVSLQYVANRRKSARLRMIEALRREEQNKVRERTAEDFHDEVGNKLTRINVLTNVLKSKLGNIPPDAERIITQIQDNTGQLYSGTRDILWSLKSSNDSLYEIIHRIRDFGQDLFGDTSVNFQFTGTDEHWQQHRLPLDMSRNLIMIFKEAMNNCLKYADAANVLLTANMDEHGFFHLELKDDGKGFDAETIKRGNGLANMNIRATRLNGDLRITSIPEQGTILKLIFKIPQNRG